ncbi:MAG TPA: methyltransferase domain-containing protein [Verrucomicrobiae bacterium]
MAALPDKLNLGCGRRKMEGHLNVDLAASVEPDCVHDLDCYPYPWPDSSFNEVVAKDVIEHIDDVVAFMKEIHRVARPGAVIRLTTPHFSCANAYVDPTHKHRLSYYSLDYFTPGHPWNFYGSSGFQIRTRSLIFTPSLLNRIVSRLANRHPHSYEQRWAWSFPAWFLYFELTVIK